MRFQRNTVQRQIVLNSLKKLNNHPSVDEVYEHINKEHPAISKSTVYRNLRQLAANGYIRQVSLPDGLERYDANADKHYHFHCKNCDSIYDLDAPYIAEIDNNFQKKFEIRHGYQIDGHDIVFSGLCQNCKQK